MITDFSDIKIAVIGLGYVGLPLAVEFGKKYSVIGFDINASRIKELQLGEDSTLEVEPEMLLQSCNLKFSNDPSELSLCNIFIITVPTPIDNQKQPDLNPLKSASKLVGGIIKSGDIIIYESTVYPGATEEVCVPILSKESELIFNRDFFVGYSPERINPGDKEHRLPSITKITSGSTPEIAKKIDKLYGSIITAGTHMASSLKVAEAAKVIENTQRDVNIALINELSIIFNILEIDTQEVLEAAGTKWNFLPFKPGLVGGHCIGVDPYYLTYKSQSMGYDPEIILAGRKINDHMAVHTTNRIIKKMKSHKINVQDSNILILGLSFKENCPDIRNTKIIDIYNEFLVYNAKVDCYDPWVSSDAAYSEYGISLIKSPKHGFYDVIVLAVAHSQFYDEGSDNIDTFGKENYLFCDLKHLFPKEKSNLRL